MWGSHFGSATSLAMSNDVTAIQANKTVENQSLISAAKSRVTAAIQRASAATGVDFTYLMNKAGQESGFRTDVKASTSSATGLFQFIEQTWLQMVKQHGDKHGLGAAADKITTNASGVAQVTDPAARRQILELRKNPDVAAAMAAELASENQQKLEQLVGGKIGKTELYLAHFLGVGGAAKFIENMRQAPQTNAANLMPNAAEANRAVFFNRDGSACSLQQIYQRFAGKMDAAPCVTKNDATAIAANTAVPDMPVLRFAQMDVGSDDESIIMPQSFTSGFNYQPTLSSPTAEPQSLFSTMMLAQWAVPGELQNLDYLAATKLGDNYSDRQKHNEA
jgi:hypothetical protein